MRADFCRSAAAFPGRTLMYFSCIFVRSLRGSEGPGLKSQSIGGFSLCSSALLPPESPIYDGSPCGDGAKLQSVSLACDTVNFCPALKMPSIAAARCRNWSETGAPSVRSRRPASA
jgi:hypothetical protein